MDQPHKCKFCGAKFHRESSLSTHMCVKKRRHMESNSAGSRLGLRTFQKFYERNTQSKGIKTLDDFINSPYYIDFVKFGNHLALLKPVHIEKFIDFVITAGLKIKDWTKDGVYDLYIEDLIKREPAVSATERTILEITEWCEKNKVAFNDFFNEISANEAAYLIKTGKISPWVLYLCESGENLMNRFNDDHAKMIGGVIEPGAWMKKFRKNEEDVEYIRNILQQAGL